MEAIKGQTVPLRSPVSKSWLIGLGLITFILYGAGAPCIALVFTMPDAPSALGIVGLILCIIATLFLIAFIDVLIRWLSRKSDKNSPHWKYPRDF